MPTKPTGWTEPQITEDHEEPPRPTPEPLTPRTNPPRANTLIAKNVTLSGTLHGEGTVQVEGTIEGEIKLKGSIIITSTGFIKGPMEADSVRVVGAVEGNVVAREHLRLERTGSIDGDVTTSSFVIEDGGRLNGRSTMPKREKKSPPVPENLSQENLQFGRNYSSPATGGEDEEEDEPQE